MKEIMDGYIIYDKNYKLFRLSDGNCVDSILEAEIWKYKEDIENTIKNFDEPENYEIWKIEKIIRTI